LGDNGQIFGAATYVTKHIVKEQLLKCCSLDFLGRGKENILGQPSPRGYMRETFV